MIQVYMKDVLSALLEVASASSAKQTSAAKAKGSKKGKAKQQADKEPHAITRDHLLSLFELSPSVLHSTRVASVEKFIAHQHLYELPPREERVHKLEERQEQQIAALMASVSKDSTSAAHSSVPSASMLPPASSVKEVSNELQSAESKQVDNTAPVKVPQPSLSPEKSKDLVLELFPEVSADDKAGSNGLAGAPSKKKRTITEETGSSGDENEAPLAANAVPAAGSTTKQDESAGGPAKEQSSKEKEKEKNNLEKNKKEIQRGRFGIWKLLTGILEGSAGNPNMQSSHRFQHQSVM